MIMMQDFTTYVVVNSAVLAGCIIYCSLDLRMVSFQAELPQAEHANDQF